MQGTSLAIATIVDQDHGKTVQCLFNPREYTFRKNNTWNQGASQGNDMGSYEFGSGAPTLLTMQLFFDTYANVKNGSSQKDVRKAYTAAIWNMMKVDTSLSSSISNAGGGSPNNSLRGRPPIVSFQWGSTWTFKAAITSISEHFTLFLPDGTPVRSTLDVTFQQMLDESWYPATNPTSGGVGGERVHIVNEGDTLAWIAYKEYGDTKLWRLIADANKLTRVRQLTPGMALEIPHA
jgi:Contractile injection system tube protein